MSQDNRELLSRSVSALGKAEFRIGYGTKGNPDAYPDGDTFKSLVRADLRPYDVWRAIVARAFAPADDPVVPRGTWERTTRWVKDDPEAFARVLHAADRRFGAAGTFGVIVFDGLDRITADWRQIDEVVRDLLMISLTLATYDRLRPKVFLREDQFSRQAMDFPDASKLLSRRVELTWAPHDLHGLLWQLLCNAEGRDGEILRGIFASVAGSAPMSKLDSWVLPEVAKREGPVQKWLFEKLAGPWMGRDHRRGIPYTWTVGHLADGLGRTSPRSFRAAIRATAEVTRDRYSDHPFPFHYESIKRGVQQASRVRVREMAEEYRWVSPLLESCEGLNVPSPFDQFRERWVTNFGGGPAGLVDSGLPRDVVDVGWDGVRAHLVRLGFLQEMADGRVNMPDLYRVGFGLGRKGGVKRPTVHADE
jgi:hypothetical protein